MTTFTRRNTILMSVALWPLLAASASAQQGVMAVQVGQSFQPPARPQPAPPAFTATPRDSRVLLSWLPVHNASTYTVKRSAGTGAPFVAITVVPAAKGHRYVDTNVQNGAKYNYRLSAIGSGGVVIKTLTASASPEAPPAPPTDLKAVVGNQQVSLTWSEKDATAESFTVKRASVSGGPYLDLTTIPNFHDERESPEYEDTGMEPVGMDTEGLFENGKTYYYVVTANDRGGVSQPSEEIKATPTLPIPGKPTSIAASAGDASVSLVWDPSEDATSYNIYRSSNGSPFKLVANVEMEAEGYSDKGLVNGTVYTYYVTGANKAGESPASPHSDATPTPSVFTPAQAIEVAREFCRAIGQPVTSTPNAVFPTPSEGANMPPLYWQRTWHIEFPGQCEVEVVDGAKIVDLYFNRDSKWDDAKPGVPKPQSQATLVYNRLLAASGQDLKELGEPSATLQQISSDSAHDWDFDTPRIFHGLEYIDQSAGALVQAETGAIITFALRFHTSIPSSDDRTITKSQAEDLATALLTKLAVKGDLKCRDAQLAVIQPNTLFQPNGSEETVSGQSVVGWNCAFSPENGRYLNVWISAKDGSLLGGSEAILH